MFDRLISSRRFVIIFLCLLLVAACVQAAPAPKNIILLIGDGMGVGPISCARAAAAPDQLAMDEFPVTGFAITYPANKLVTDSAAAGTALATGAKTNNGMISMDPEGNVLKNIREVAQEIGKATGIISTKPVVDATPAVFASHVKNRGEGLEIASQMTACGVDVILGGGSEFFLPKTVEGGAREDGRDLLQEAAKQGYEICTDAVAMDASKSNKIIGLFNKGALTTVEPEPSIAQMTAKAISVLSKDPDGFFLMTEGGQIDSFAHGNDAENTVRQTLLFDEAVRVALEFAKKDGNTLVVVTADHDTGGMALFDPNEENPKFTARYVNGGHNANMLPIYAFGPGAELFTGTHQNTYIPNTFATLWGKKLR